MRIIVIFVNGVFTAPIPCPVKSEDQIINAIKAAISGKPGTMYDYNDSTGRSISLRGDRIDGWQIYDADVGLQARILNKMDRDLSEGENWKE